MNLTPLTGLDSESSVTDVLTAFDAADFGHGRVLDTCEVAGDRNAYRASLAVGALRVFGERCNELDEPAETVISDLFGDLMHMADLLGVDWMQLVDRAAMNHDAEKMGE